jgi:hypothetical protein
MVRASKSRMNEFQSVTPHVSRTREVVLAAKFTRLVYITDSVLGDGRFYIWSHGFLYISFRSTYYNLRLKGQLERSTRLGVARDYQYIRY